MEICYPVCCSFLHFFINKRSSGVQHGPIWAQVYVRNVIFARKKEASKNASKKGAPPDSNRYLFTCREAPGEAASRAHCTDKKQLFEQQLKHCSRFLKKKGDWAQNWCRKTDRIAESLQNT